MAHPPSLPRLPIGVPPGDSLEWCEECGELHCGPPVRHYGVRVNFEEGAEGWDRGSLWSNLWLQRVCREHGVLRHPGEEDLNIFTFGQSTLSGPSTSLFRVHFSLSLWWRFWCNQQLRKLASDHSTRKRTCYYFSLFSFSSGSL